MSRLDRCWAFSLMYNERDLLPYWCRHYRTFCERLVVFVQDDSDDGSAEVARREGADVRLVPSCGLDDQAFVAFAQEHYPEARGRARWFVWVDADEFLLHPAGTAQRLDRLAAEDVTYPHVQGYAMVAPGPPTGRGQIYDELRRGVPSREYSKPCVFSPWVTIAWGVGKHDAVVTGAGASAVVRDAGMDPFKLLHYRYLGAEWQAARNARNTARMVPQQRGQWGTEVLPGYQGAYSLAWYAQHEEAARDVV